MFSVSPIFAASALNYPGGKDIASTEAIRTISRLMVLSVLRNNPCVSLGQLAELVPLSRTTISGIVKEMSDVGLVQKAGLADSTGGRRSALLRYHAEAWQVVGVALMDDDVLAVLTDLEGHPLHDYRKAWHGQTPEDLLKAMIAAVQEVCQGTDRTRILGVGVGLPGMIDIARGSLEMTPSRGWLGPSVPARRIIEQALGLPAVVASRSHIIALGELRAGAGQGVNSLLYLWIGRGVVAGIVLNHEMYFGSGSFAGEIGHTTIDADGPLCQCGNRGCLEVFTCERAIITRGIAKAREMPESLMRQVTNGNLLALTIDDIVACAREGDRTAIDVLNETGTDLGIALSAALHLLNPEMLVLGGPVGCKAGQLLLEPTVREIERRTLPLLSKGLRVASGTGAADCVAVGAAMLALQYTPIERIFGTLVRAGDVSGLHRPGG